MGMIPPDWRLKLPRNVWVGTSIEDDETARDRIPVLAAIPARVRFLSCEPLIGPLDLDRFMFSFCRKDPFEEDCPRLVRGDFCADCLPDTAPFDWVIVGGESGPKARDMEIGWVTRLVIDCQNARIPIFVKQMGSRFAIEAGLSKKDAKGEDMTFWPRIARVREFPA